MLTEPHQKRVVVEADELETKTTALKSFFETDIFKNLSGTDQTLLIAQHAAMVAYWNILRLRIEAFYAALK